MRDRGSGPWLCTSPGAVPQPTGPAKSRGRSHRSAPADSAHEGGRRLESGTRGLCGGGHDSAALAALGRVPPARARPSTCAPRSPWGSRRLLRANVSDPRAPPRERVPQWPLEDALGTHGPGATPDRACWKQGTHAVEHTRTRTRTRPPRPLEERGTGGHLSHVCVGSAGSPPAPRPPVSAANGPGSASSQGLGQVSPRKRDQDSLLGSHLHISREAPFESSRPSRHVHGGAQRWAG
ncbi:uncharacterized protein LOC107196057 isoform X2 [Pteropus alecto]|uniref:uncharacterized protein LOC107196057 isoform X2 n=1 Tax=Pteropus alecto TaxID=9402 RepID=UPI000D53AF7E|nr:uncharacterized protein LOC107196057 isoform X2 [Pteropus alecto]